MSHIEKKEQKVSFRKRFNQVVAGIVSGSILLGSFSPAMAGVNPSNQDKAAKVNVAVPTVEDLKKRYEFQDGTQNQQAMDGEKYLLNKATSAVSSTLENALKDFGTAKVTLSGANEGSLDVLHPLSDDGKSLWFFQGGIRRTNQYTADYRTTLNLGGGYRYFYDNKYLLGLNGFYDMDLNQGHRRYGIGGEFFADYMKLSANGYLRGSNWKNSPDINYYLERPANGFDIRFEGYLPQHPQLGAKLMYEKYYGNEVGLFGYGSRQSNPSATTIGLTYSPAPALTFGIEKRKGQGGLSDTMAKVELKYQLGVPFSKQFSFNEVAKTREVKSMRTHLVERNNNIVLEYKRADNLSINLPAKVSGYGDQTVDFSVSVIGNNEKPVLKWEGTAASFVQSWVDGASSAKLQLPAYKITGVNTYTLSAVATSFSGRIVRSNEMIVSVNPVAIKLSNSKATVIADGADTVDVIAQISGVSNEAVANKSVDWTIATGSAKILSFDAKTNASGIAKATLSSQLPGNVTVKVNEVNSDGSKGTDASTTFAFNWNNNSAVVSTLTANPLSATANGTDTITLRALVVDALNNPAAVGTPVYWSVDGGTLAGPTTTTDNAGYAQVVLTAPTKVSTVTATAKARVADAGKTVAINFVAGAPANVSVVASPNSIVADGISKTQLTVTIKDATGNVVPNASVSLSTTGGSLSGTTGTTDANGVFTGTLTSPKTTGTLTVTAKSGAATSTTQVTLTAGSASTIAVSVSQASIVATGATTSIASAMVKDVNGNLVPGATVSWSTSLGSITSSSVTDASGVAVATFTSSTTTGAATITGATNSKTGTATVTMTAGAASLVTVTASPTSMVASGATTSVATAVVKDVNGNLVPGATVTWSATLGSVTASSQTNPSGVATATFTSGKIAGSAVITASTGGKSGSANVTLTAGATSAIVVNVSPNTMVATGATTGAATATVSDVNGNVISGATVIWTTNLGSITGSSVTDVNGVAAATFTSGTVSGISTVTAAAGGKSGTATVTLTAGAPATVAVTATPSSITATGSSTSALLATVKDVNGNLVPGVTVTWTSSLGTVTGSSVTNASGVAAATLTSSTVAGSATVTGTTNGKAATATVTFTAGAASSVVVSASPTSMVANGVTTSVATAVVKDINGNLVPGAIVTWTTTLGTISASSTTNASGVATATLTSATVAGTSMVTATTNSNSGSVSVVYTAGAASTVTVTASPASIVANGASTSLATATVKDVNGNLVPDVTVTWTTTLGAVTGTSVTNAGGVATATFTSGTVTGSSTVSASTGGKSGTATVTLTAGAASTVMVSASPSSIEATGSATSTLSATVKDDNGNLVPGVTVNWTSSLGAITGSSITNTSGVATAALTSTTSVGAADVVATTNGKSATTSVSFVAGAASTVTVTASPTTVVANGTTTSTATATVKDAYGNLVPGATVTWSANLGTMSSPSSVTNASGVATATFTSGKVTGASTVTAATGGKSGTATVTLTAGAASMVLVSVSPSSIPASGSATSTASATVMDVNGNRVPGVTVTWSATLGSITGSSTTNASGVATATFTGGTTLGVGTISAVVGGSNGSTSITLTPAAAETVTVSATPTSIVANGATTSVVTAVLRDAFGNLVPGASVSWSTTSGSIGGSSTSDAAGVATATLTSSTAAGTATVKATSNGKQGTAAVTFTPGAVANVTVTSSQGSVIANGSASSVITGIVTDAYGNPVPGATVTWTTSIGTIAGSSTTNTSGVTTVTLTSTTGLGYATVTGSSGGKSGSTGVSFVVGSVASIAFWVETASIPYTGGSSILNAVAYDSVGHVVPGAILNWSTSLGYLNYNSTATDGNGLSRITLLSNGGKGTAYLAVSNGGVVSYANVSIYAPSETRYDMNRDNITYWYNGLCYPVGVEAAAVQNLGYGSVYWDGVFIGSILSLPVSIGGYTYTSGGVVLDMLEDADFSQCDEATHVGFMRVTRTPN